jgi:hypothetical protein
VKVLVGLAKGFLAMTITIAFYCSITLVKVGQFWLGLLYLLILALPISYFVILWRSQKRIEEETSSSAEKWKTTLFALEGAALACWGFDVSTTFYAINVTQLAAEVNPLGWPFGIVGALAFYAPTLVFSYFLLSKKSDKLSLRAGSILSLLMIFMAFMNLEAGSQNFVFFLATVSLPINLNIPLLTLVVLTESVFLGSQLRHFGERRISRLKLEVLS